MSSQVPAIDRAIRVLYLFRDGNQKEYGVSEISRLLKLNKSTVHNILNTLAHHRFLVQSEATRRYRLGPALAELGGVVSSRIDMREVARPHLRRLMEQTGATILLSILDGAVITIIDKEEPVSTMRVAASIGMNIPFCAGAQGKVFLAFLPDEAVDQLLVDPGLKAFTPTAITNPEQYRIALTRIRTQGYAIDDNEEYLPGVGAIAVPIFAPELGDPTAPVRASTPGRAVTAVITLVSFSSQLCPKKIAEFTTYLVDAGQKISRELGVSSL